MIIPEAYNAFSSYLTTNLQWLSDSVSGSYNTFYTGSQNWLSSISNSPFGAIFLPFNTAVLWLLSAFYALTQNFALWISILIGNIDLIVYCLLSWCYFTILFLFLIKFIAMPLNILLIFLPFAPLFVFLKLNLAKDPNPILSTKNLCVNFLDYWFIEYQISLYLVGVLAIFCGSHAFGILDFILYGSLLQQIFAGLFQIVILLPVFFWIYKMVCQNLSPVDSAEEVKVFVKGIFKIT